MERMEKGKEGDDALNCKSGGGGGSIYHVQQKEEEGKMDHLVPLHFPVSCTK